ncbi:MAG: hypothetical protein JNL19_01875 [Burkholderiales bacterium]|nr:hypothetical protein [Burkholderiales bacterium]
MATGTKPIEIMLVDFAAHLPILRQQAAAHVFAESTHYGWRHIELMTNWTGEIGIWEAQVPNASELRKAIQAQTIARAVEMVRVAQNGPVALCNWLLKQYEIRDHWLDNYFYKVSQFNQINRNTLNVLDRSVKELKLARFVAELGLIYGTVAVGAVGLWAKVTGKLATSATGVFYSQAGAAVAVPVIGLTKSLSFAAIKTWDDCKRAKALSLGFEVGKAATNEGSGALGGEGIARGTSLLVASADDTAAAKEVIEAAKVEAARQAQQRVRDADKQLQDVIARGPKRNSKQSRRLFEAEKKSLKAVSEAEKQALRKVEAEAAKEAERQIEAQVAKEAARVYRGQLLRRAGMALSAGSLTFFAAWDLHDALEGLSE